MRVGASLVIELSPTGLRQSSAMVCIRYTKNEPRNANLDAGLGDLRCRYQDGRSRAPRRSRPSANFVGLAGCRCPSRDPQPRDELAPAP